MLEVMQWGSLLLYATQRGGIHAWDLRADTNAWTLPCTSNQARFRKYFFQLSTCATFQHSYSLLQGCPAQLCTCSCQPLFKAALFLPIMITYFMLR